MGLDNMPKNLPNETCNRHRQAFPGPSSERPSDWEDAAPLDCGAAAAAGDCVWDKKLGGQQGVTYGMFGAPCWYRGKYGNFLAGILGVAGDLFYGTEKATVDEEGLSPVECINLADTLETKLRQHDGPPTTPEQSPSGGEDLTPDILYAVEWLRFAADYGGSAVWY